METLQSQGILSKKGKSKISQKELRIGMWVDEAGASAMSKKPPRRKNDQADSMQIGLSTSDPERSSKRPRTEGEMRKTSGTHTSADFQASLSFDLSNQSSSIPLTSKTPECSSFPGKRKVVLPVLSAPIRVELQTSISSPNVQPTNSTNPPNPQILKNKSRGKGKASPSASSTSKSSIKLEGKQDKITRFFDIEFRNTILSETFSSADGTKLEDQERAAEIEEKIPKDRIRLEIEEISGFDLDKVSPSIFQ